MAQGKKKVLFTSHTANFSKFNRPFMRWFSEQGYEVHYASMGEEQVLDCDKHFTVPFTRSPFKLSNIAAYHQLKKIIDAENYDIIHTHTPMGSVVTRLAAKTARKNGTRVIYTAHGFHFFTGAPLLNWLIYYPVEKFMARHTDTLITINKEDYERAKRKFSTDVRYVPGVGIDPKKFDFKMSKAEKLKLRKSLGLKEDDFVMIYPAELNKNKNQTMLIDAMEQLVKDHPNIHVLLPGLDSMNGYHKKLAEKKGLSSNIHFLGYRNDIPQLLKVSDISVSTSQREGLPVNILEAMSIGLPIITVNCRGNRELVEDGRNGFSINLNDSKDLLSKLINLLNNRTTMDEFYKNNKSYVKKYLLDNVLQEMSLIYNSNKEAKMSKKDTIKKPASCLFVHDFKYLEYKSNMYGEGQFEYSLWKKKYLSIFDSITVVARGKEVNREKEIQNKYQLNGDGVRFISTDSLASLQRLLNTSKVRETLNGAVEENDMAIVRLPSIQGLVACSLLEKKNKPYIVEVVGSAFGSLWYHDRLKGKIIAPILHTLNKKAIKKAPHAIYVTNEYLQKVYPNNHNTLACSDVIIENLDSAILDKRLKKINSYNDKTTFKLGLVGSYDVMYKGHDTAIRAISKLTNTYNIELHFLGSGSKETWINLAKKYNVESNIHFDNPLNSGPDMHKWFDAMDILLIPSKTEGMPRVLLEGMSRASVIVASDVGDVPYVLDNKYVIKKHDWRRLALQIKILLNSKKLMRQAAQVNFSKANAFHITKLSEKRDKFVEEIALRIK